MEEGEGKEKTKKKKKGQNEFAVAAVSFTVCLVFTDIVLHSIKLANKQKTHY